MPTTLCKRTTVKGTKLLRLESLSMTDISIETAKRADDLELKLCNY